MDAPLSPEAISARLPASRRIGREIQVLAETTSTNDVVAEAARAGASEGLVVFAETQSAGRGRMQRKWESAAGEGLWFSVLLRPTWPLADWARLTTWAGVAVARGMEAALPGCHAGIKWPNDIHLGGRKAVGILAESAAGPKGWAIVGIGVNVNQTAFPEEIRNVATSLRLAAGAEAAPLDRNAVAGALLGQLDALYTVLERDFTRIVVEAGARSVLLGRSVMVHDPAGPYEAQAEGLEADGGLRVRLPDGSVNVICTGEVSVRGL
jgi:BirA family transcriptional regulator, biotin operon repressor / biotin---[acetyl-CoA-carboxylase] ligase